MVMEMSKTYQYRKVMKPLLERKRRARINKCLDDLKDLMVECLQQEGEHVTRLEKADILELTVEHMRKLKQRGGLSLNAPTSAAHVESFRSGYVHAADQISQVLLHQRHNDEVGAKILKFLSTRLLEMQPQLYHNAKSTPPTTTTFSMLPFEPTAGINRLSSVTSLTPIDVHTRRNILTTNRNICMTGKDLANSCDLLIDVTTVDNVSSDNASVISVDSSSSSDTVWRPW